MINLKNKNREDYEVDTAPAIDKNYGPSYPWGTQLTLEGEILEDLGCWDCEVGDTMMITGVVKVKNKNENERQGEEPRRSMELQITKMDLGDAESLKASIKKKTAKKAYDEEEY